MQKPKVGLLGLTLGFYEQLAPELSKSRERFVRERLMPALGEIADVQFDRAMFKREDIESAITRFEADRVDVLLIILLTYSPSLVAAPALKQTRLPIVIWNTQELYAVDESCSDKELAENHGVHGTHDLCNVLVRADVPFGYVTGHLKDPGTIPALNALLRAGFSVSRLRRARLGLIGYPFPGMGDFGCDLTHMAATLGCAWEALPLAEYHKRATEADPSETKRLTDAYRSRYEIGKRVTDSDLAATARSEIALRGLIRDYRLDGYSYQFLAFGEDDRSETLPFVAASRLLAEGIGFGGEGDLIAAAHSALLSWLHPPASFSEMFTIDFGGNAVLLSHMGEANVAMARTDRKPRLVARGTPIVPTRCTQLSLISVFQPGQATLTALTLTSGQRWRIIASLVTTEDFGPLAGLDVPHTKLRPSGDVREFLDAYARAGGPHHLAICFGDARRELAMTAQFLGAEYVEI